MRIARELYDQLIAHARAEAPNECCGVVSTRDGEAVKVYPTTNRFASPLRFEIDGLELLKVSNEIDAARLDLGILYHSHTRTAPEPSQTDINGSGLWPGVIWVIVGLANEQPEVRAWSIADGQVTEAELIVESD